MILDVTMDSLHITSKAPAKKGGGHQFEFSKFSIFVHYQERQNTTHIIGGNICNSYYLLSVKYPVCFSNSHNSITERYPS